MSTSEQVGSPDVRNRIPNVGFSGLVTIALVITASLVAVALISVGASTDKEEIGGLDRLGVFEYADARDAEVSHDRAAEVARGSDLYRKESQPEVALVRFVEPASDGSGTELVGTLAWVFHWGGIGEEVVQGLGTSADPTAWTYSDFYLLVDATTGAVIYGQMR